MRVPRDVHGTDPPCSVACMPLTRLPESRLVDLPGVRAQLGHWLAQQGTHLPADARILLVTLPRVFGYIFAPVSFYFCHAADGTLSVGPRHASSGLLSRRSELRTLRVQLAELEAKVAAQAGDAEGGPPADERPPHW